MQAKKNDVHLQFKEGADRNFMVDADRENIRQVFINLILNAIKYGKEDGYVKVSFYDMENGPDLAVRHGKWKLLCDYDGGRPELYDLDADRGETNNVAADEPTATSELVNQAVAWWQSMPCGDPSVEG